MATTIAETEGKALLTSSISVSSLLHRGSVEFPSALAVRFPDVSVEFTEVSMVTLVGFTEDVSIAPVSAAVMLTVELSLDVAGVDWIISPVVGVGEATARATNAQVRTIHHLMVE